MPCWELFAEQTGEYQHQVLPPAQKRRVSIEAGVTLGWRQYIGDHGIAIGVDRYGASAPAEVIYEKLGLTPTQVAAAVKRVISAG
jgi:transketolase